MPRRKKQKSFWIVTLRRATQSTAEGTSAVHSDPSFRVPPREYAPGEKPIADPANRPNINDPAFQKGFSDLFASLFNSPSSAPTTEPKFNTKVFLDPDRHGFDHEKFNKEMAKHFSEIFGTPHKPGMA